MKELFGDTPARTFLNEILKVFDSKDFDIKATDAIDYKTLDPNKLINKIILFVNDPDIYTDNPSKLVYNEYNKELKIKRENTKLLFKYYYNSLL